ncbi:MAG: hypothetical protein MSS69_06555 [Spirochaetales bacterium]|nr:hypothetical protein [Spirochaetales bacterium]
MKKIIALILIISLVFSLSAETITHSSFNYKYESYEEEEFPLWTIELRRAETVFFGSLVFTVPISSVAIGLLSNQGIINFNNTTQAALVNLSAAAGLSLVVAAVDWVLGKME